MNGHDRRKRTSGGTSREPTMCENVQEEYKTAGGWIRLTILLVFEVQCVSFVLDLSQLEVNLTHLNHFAYITSGQTIC